MAVDIQALFNEKLPAALTKSPDKAKEIGATFQINIAGEGGGNWNIDCSDSGPKCEATTADADCTIDVAAEDFQSLVSNPAAGMQLFMSGKLKVQGNQMLAMKLQSLFSLTD